MATIPFSRHVPLRSQSAPAPRRFEKAGRIADRFLLAARPYLLRYARQRRMHWAQSAVAFATAVVVFGIWFFALRGL